MSRNPASCRSPLWRRACSLLAVGLLLLGPGGGSLLWAGGALAVVGPAAGLALEGTPYIFDISGGPVEYHVDGGPMASGGTVDILNPEGNARVDAMFAKWRDVQTSALDFTNAGVISLTAGFSDGDVSDTTEWQAVAGNTGSTCALGIESMIVFDADGSLFTALGFSPGVIGFAGPCAIIPSTGKIVTAKGALNGKFQNNGGVGGDLSPDGFDGAFIHEFGHMFGMDHSQVNLICLSGGCVNTDDAFGLPTMFPSLTNATEGGVSAIVTLSEDDRAWVSSFYPETVNDAPGGKVPFASAYGAIEGTIRFSDGVTHAQGVNVIARQVDDPGTVGVDESRRIALSGVSGLWFSVSPGQTLTGTNTGGDPFFGGQADKSLTGFYSIPLPPGVYTIEVESVFAGFTGGSSINPFFDAPIPMPGGVPEFYSGGAETDSDQPRTSPSDTVTVPVTAGATVTGIDIILNGTIARFDAFESAGILPGPELAPPQPLWTRKDEPELTLAGETA